MPALDFLSTSLGRKDEVPNQLLARKICENNDKSAVKELVENLYHKNKSIQGDCIKTLYEIGEHNPLLIAGYVKEFIALLDSKNNRLQWGAMTAIDTITAENKKEVFGALGKIIKVVESGSVITRDHYVNILVKLCADKKYSGKVFPLITEQIMGCPVNQLPMYAERALPIIDEGNKSAFLRALTKRLADVEQESKRKRMEKVIRKLTK
jgi:hypothetical protein